MKTDDATTTSKNAVLGTLVAMASVSSPWAEASKTEEDEVVAQAVAAGATLVKEPQQVFWVGYRGYFKDLDGHLWEVAHNPFFWVGPQDEDSSG